MRLALFTTMSLALGVEAARLTQTKQLDALQDLLLEQLDFAEDHNALFAEEASQTINHPMPLSVEPTMAAKQAAIKNVPNNRVPAPGVANSGLAPGRSSIAGEANSLDGFISEFQALSTNDESSVFSQEIQKSVYSMLLEIRNEMQNGSAQQAAAAAGTHAQTFSDSVAGAGGYSN